MEPSYNPTKTVVSEQKCCQNLDFSYILLENFAKTMEGPQKKQSFGAKTLEGPKKVFGVWSCQTTQCSKTLCFFLLFLDPPAFWHQNFGFLWYPSRFWEHFGAKPCQNHGGSQKTMLQNFVVLFVLGPSSVLASKLWFFWDPSRFWEHFGAKPCQNQRGSQKKQSAKTLEYPKKNNKNKVLESGAAKLPNAPKLCVFMLFWTLLCFGTKTSFFLELLKVLGAFWSTTLPKPRRVQKNQSFGAKTLEGPKTTKKDNVLESRAAKLLNTP